MSRVLDLSNRLISDGVDCHLDRYEPFPEEGWPHWMNDQIHKADYVLVICTETYNRRVAGRESPGRGLGARWEGHLITQQIYESGGRNLKFIPVIFEESDGSHVPTFLALSSRFCVATPNGYEELYRLITTQPAVVKPSLGPLRQLSGNDKLEKLDTHKIIDNKESKPTIYKSREAVVIWRLPRGFVLLEELYQTSNPSWATTASYWDYRGRDIHGTHYHESYRWLDKYEAVEAQCAKLHVPRGDWMFARSPVYFMVEVREGRCSVSHQGVITGSYTNSMLQGDHAYVIPAGDIPLPEMPPEYRPLMVSGPIRDLASEAEDLLKNRPSLTRIRLSPGDFAESVGRLRREVRIEVHRKLSENHPAAKNIEEIIVRYKPEDDNEREAWLGEFKAAIWEAARCIEYQAS